MAASEALQPPPAFRSVPGSLFQRRAALTQEIIPDMLARLRAKSIPAVRLIFQDFMTIRIRRFLQVGAGCGVSWSTPARARLTAPRATRQFITLPRIGNFFHGLSVTVACLEVHPGIQPRRVLAQGKIDQT